MIFCFVLFWFCSFSRCSSSAITRLFSGVFNEKQKKKTTTTLETNKKIEKEMALELKFSVLV